MKRIISERALKRSGNCVSRNAHKTYGARNRNDCTAADVQASRPVGPIRVSQSEPNRCRFIGRTKVAQRPAYLFG